MAKQRLEALRTLPEKLFFLILNFQIPGNPPVSIVAYCAVPCDIIERFPGQSTEQFINMFERFIDMPRNETERFAAWGVSAKLNEDQSIQSSDSSDAEGEEESKPKSSIWRLPTDITWPDVSNVGTLPQSDFRNTRMKIIPSILEGNMVVRAAVRPVPAIIGRKVVQRYFRSDDYLEIDIHVGSSIIASNIVGVVRGYAKNMVGDVGIVLQGETPDELPEKLLCCVTMNKVNVNIRKKLD